MSGDIVELEKLPDGYSLELDSDGDWVLIPPSDVTIFSVPGESFVIGRCAKDIALKEALAYLMAALEEPTNTRGYCP